ncbi:MAG: peptidase S9, partial [Actinomycetota bacterium]
MAIRRLLVLAVALTVLGGIGCTAADPAPPAKHAEPARSAAATGPPAPPTAEVTATPPAAPHPVSLPAMFGADHDGRALELGDVLARTDAYTRYAVTYTGDGLT